MVRKLPPWLRSCIACLAGCLLISTATAEIRVNGFANVVFGSTFDEDELTYGYDDKLDFSNESLFALQFTSDMGDGLSAVGQVVARGASDFEAEFAWAYISYDLSDQSNVKYGRLRLPFYTYSDFVEVGYAYHWVRTPATVYSLGFNNVDGVSYSYNGTIGDWDSGFQVLYGRFKGTSNPGGIESPTEFKDVFSTVWNLSYDEWAFRLAYSTCGECFIDFPYEDVLGFDLLGTLVGAGESEVATNIAIDGDSGSFIGFGAKYDSGNWFVEAEATSLEVEDSFQADAAFWYITGGIRSGDFTWHLTYEKQNSDAKPEIYAGLTNPVLLVPVQAFVDAQDSVNTRYTIGMRYDFHPSAAFKLDFLQIDEETNPIGDRGLVSAAIVTVF